METFYKNKKTADYFNGFCGERGTQTYGFLEYHKTLKRLYVRRL